MTGPSIGERQNLERVLAKSPIVKAVLEQQRLEDLEKRRAAIAHRKTADERFAAAEASREERLQRLDAEFRPIEAKYQAAKQKLETTRQLIEQEVATARCELFNADQAIRRLPPLEKFEAWREQTSRSMQLATPQIDPRPKLDKFRNERAFERALEEWNAKASALSEQVHETARMVRSTMNLAPSVYATDEEAIAACELVLRSFSALVTWPSTGLPPVPGAT